MNSIILYEYGSLKLIREFELSNDVLSQLQNTVYGNPGGIRYLHQDVDKKIRKINNLSFGTLRKNNQLYLIIGVCERITYFKEVPCGTFYLRYVTVNTAFAKKAGTSKTLKEKKVEARSSSLLKKAMEKISEIFNYVALPDEFDKTKRLYFAYIEEENYRSLEFTEFFFEKIRDFSVIPYSRLLPRKNKNVSLLNEYEIKEIIGLLKNQYRNYTLFSFDNLNFQEDYYVLKKNNEIIAGVKANIVKWKIVNLPGLTGKLIIYLIPFLPLFSRLIKRKIFRFLAFEALYYKEGMEQYIPILMESVCGIKKVYAGLLYADMESPLYHVIKNIKKPGILNKMFGETSGKIVARFIGFNDKEKEVFKSNPAYISGFDIG